MEINQEVGIVVLKPQGRLGLEQAAGMLSKIRAAEAGVEFDLSQVDSIEVSMLQVILVTVASMRRRGLLAVVKDSDSGVLRQKRATCWPIWRPLCWSWKPSRTARS
jgi:anti-anti-sigma regulatory factor